MYSPFYPRQDRTSKDKYSRLLLGFAQASRFFSSNDKPFIHYRAAENIFCKSFAAENVSRQDCSVDAYKEKDGIGIKTFLSKRFQSFEKIAEFNDADKYPFDYMDRRKLLQQVVYYRNERLNDTFKRFDLKNSLYHYLLRDVSKILICECEMALIDDRNIKLRPSRRAHIIKFTDGNFLYHFHMTKNTLYKAFDTTNALDVIEIPAGIDGKLLGEALKEFTVEDEKEADLITTKEYVILPLFSTRTKEVPEKSGLNQWNAGGRARDYDEVYIPIPKIVHKAKPDFFPARDSHFKLKTQDGREFTAKVCQDNSKALMTTPNKDLGKWLLRDVLGLEYGQIADYDFLKEKGADTVIIYKLSESEYQIALHTVGVFQEEYSEED